MDQLYYIHHSKEWERIGKALKIFFELNHFSTFQIFDSQNQMENVNEKIKKITSDDAYVILPLFEKDNDHKNYYPFGLETILEIRQKTKQYNFICIFLVLSEKHIPKHTDTEKLHGHAKKIIGIPQFEDVNKAIYYGELVFNDDKITNVIPLVNENSLEMIKRLIKQPQDILKNNNSFLEKYKEKFYNTFVNYYNKLFFTEDKYEQLKHIENCNKLYMDYHEISIKRHNPDNKNLFVAPYPFKLQELLNMINELHKYKDKEDNCIKLLLIDNNTYKYYNDQEKNEGPLLKLFSEFNLDHLFQIRMLNVKSINEMKKNFHSKFEKFDYSKFTQNDILSEEEIKYFFSDNPIKNYTDFILKRIGESDIILLDFFLNDDPSYLAFDFIKDVTKSMHDKNNYSTVWYFISSAMYDSVEKHSNSGLLAQYYESAVVNPGDDPTNERRQIIFIYKILLFIQGRLKNYKNFRESVFTSEFFKCTKYDCKWNQARNCLTNIKSLCQKYLSEHNNIINLFPSLINDSFEDNIELINAIINQFIYSPEADWAIIQMQIDKLNYFIKSNEEYKSLVFKCSYIKNELIKRSNIY